MTLASREGFFFEATGMAFGVTVRALSGKMLRGIRILFFLNWGAVAKW